MIIKGNTCLKTQGLLTWREEDPKRRKNLFIGFTCRKFGPCGAKSSLFTGRFTITNYHLITELSALGNYNEAKRNGRFLLP